MDQGKRAKLCLVLEKRCSAIEKENLMLAHRVLQARRLIRRNKKDVQILKAELERHGVDITACPVDLLLHSDEDSPHDGVS
ncbi:hypothetical protein FHG87_011242 [Trinorchestia longiramus]|nr:hypothetical protein FHG87_011242 [Trinorchestia longiramus]